MNLLMVMCVDNERGKYACLLLTCDGTLHREDSYVSPEEAIGIMVKKHLELFRCHFRDMDEKENYDKDKDKVITALKENPQDVG